MRSCYVHSRYTKIFALPKAQGPVSLYTCQMTTRFGKESTTINLGLVANENEGEEGRKMKDLGRETEV